MARDGNRMATNAGLTAPTGTEQLDVRAGQFLFIPAGMSHLPFNPSDSEACVAVLARTDPNDQESVVLLDENGRRPTNAL
jgi:uncharacterized RmlC-like cupin family protein